jgi:Tol biopolymer transport system component
VPDPPSPDSAASAGAKPPEDRLDSWKDIAAHLKRDVSTVQRWEKKEGMPVHRHFHDKLGSVFASRAELDAWSRSRSPSQVGGESGEAAGGGEPPLEPPSPVARATAAPPPLPSGHRRVALLALGCGLLAGLGAAAWLVNARNADRRNPLAEARFSRLTDFEGTEQAAAISRDGSFVAFLSDRDGATDVWVTQVGTGQFHNLTRGAIRELVNPSLRTLGFSADATLVFLWTRRPDAPPGGGISVWAVPTMGGPPRLYLEDVAELDWSHDGSRLVYHSPAAGDPLFVKERDRPGQQILAAPPGQHGHFPIWSPDDKFIYFVQGTLPDEMDIWRLAPGGAPERLTFHNAHVSHPTFLDRRTLLYLATAEDGSGPWVHAMDVRRRQPRRISFGVETYRSLSASLDGSRLVATVANPKGTLWRVPLSDQPSDSSAPRRIVLPTVSARSPRFGPNSLLYVSSQGGSEGIWKLASETAVPLWSAPGSRVVGGPALSRDGRIAFTVEEHGRTRLLAMDEDGTDVRVLDESLDFRGAPAWAPDAQSIVVAANRDGVPQLMRVPVRAGAPAPLVPEYALDPTWSPDGRFLVYSGPDVGTTFTVKAVGGDGRPHPLSSLTLTRGARRLAFVPGRRPALVVLRGEIAHKDFWLVDLETRSERRLTHMGPEFAVRDFDVSPDGREIVFDHAQENSDIVLVDLPPR